MNKLKLSFLSLVACCAMFAQTATTTQTIQFVSSATLYTCTARSVQARNNGSGVITVTAASNANPVSFTATAHGITWVSGSFATPVVTISGATGAWAVINGEWVATPTSADAFTIPVNSTSLGALAGTLVVTTSSPRITEAVWRVEKSVFDGTTAPLATANNLLFHGYGFAPLGAGGAALRGPALGFNQICANRALLSYQ